MRKTIARLSGLLLLLGALQVVPAAAATRVYVRVAPPVEIVETRPAAPHRGWVWRPGYHRWVHNRYEWVRGGWVKPPRGRSAWVPGHWDHERRGYFWVPGHWDR
jgi:hypothetical protein